MNPPLNKEVGVGRSTTEHTLQTRLKELRLELQRGEMEFAALERRRVHVTETLLRISGAIQVLEELSPPADSAPASGTIQPQSHEGVHEPVKARAYG